MRKNNFKKSVLWIALLMLCLATTSCDQAAKSSDTSHTEMTEQDSTDVAFQEAPYEKETASADIVVDLQPYTASLPYDLSSVPFQVPHEDEYYSSEHKMIEDQTVLGHRCNIEKYSYRMRVGGTLYHTICTEINTDRVFLQGGDLFIEDLNHDGDSEVVYDHHILVNTSDGIMIADINMAADHYLKSILPQGTQYTYEMNGGVLKYKINTRGEDAFESHELKLAFTGSGFDILYDHSYFYDKLAPFASNDPDWSVTVSYTEIPHPIFSRTVELYTLTVSGPLGQNYVLYGQPPFPTEHENIIGTRCVSDARFPRDLIVHPNGEYALLIYPYIIETVDDMQGTDYALIDLTTGSLIGCASSRGIIYKQFATHEEWYEVLGKQWDNYGNFHTILQEVENIENGFSIHVYAHNREGKVIVSADYEIDFDQIQSQSID